MGNLSRSPIFHFSADIQTLAILQNEIDLRTAQIHSLTRLGHLGRALSNHWNGDDYDFVLNNLTDKISFTSHQSQFCFSAIRQKRFPLPPMPIQLLAFSVGIAITGLTTEGRIQDKQSIVRPISLLCNVLGMTEPGLQHRAFSLHC
jgi:hypothetical protein